MTSPTRMRFILMIAAGGTLAAIGSLAEGYHVEQGFDGVGWAFRSCATIVVMAFVLGGIFSADWSETERWSRVVSALLVALFLPYAVESVRYETRGDVALVATIFSVVLASRGGVLRCVAAGVAICLACACDATGLAWPIGCAWAAFAGRGSRQAASAILVGGVIGVVVGRSYGWPFFSWPTIGGGLAGVHRDLIVLLPMMLLGVVGFSAVRSRSNQEQTFRSVLLSWTAVAMVLLFLAMLGAPLDLRLCVLPVMLWMPVALVELRNMVTTAGGAERGLRGIGYLSCGVVVCLLIPDLMRLMDGPLIAVYLLSG